MGNWELYAYDYKTHAYNRVKCGLKTTIEQELVKLYEKYMWNPVATSDCVFMKKEGSKSDVKIYFADIDYGHSNPQELWLITESSQLFAPFVYVARGTFSMIRQLLFDLAQEDCRNFEKNKIEYTPTELDAVTYDDENTFYVKNRYRDPESSTMFSATTIENVWDISRRSER